MSRLLILLTSLLLVHAAAFAASDGDESVLPGVAKRKTEASTVVRQESLELPGLTACHQCEWRPHLHEMGAADRCGTDASGAAKVAQFECGFSPDCDRVCTFLRCAE
jgi:hypothetical protein